MPIVRIRANLPLIARHKRFPDYRTGTPRGRAADDQVTCFLNPHGVGIKDVNASNWTALLVRKATPHPIIDKLNAEVVHILNMPDVKERFAAGGVKTTFEGAAEKGEH